MISLEITPVILTFNEEANISRTLERLTWARRIVVVDSLSSDATVRLARNFPQVAVISRAFTNHEDQWNFALDQADTEWVLTLDADYLLSRESIAELQTMPAAKSGAVGYYAKFRYCVGGRPLRGSLYPPRIVLFRRSRGRYVNDGHTQKLRLDGTAGWLSSVIFHDDRKSLDAWLAAQNRYSTLEARKLSAASEAQLGFPDRIRRRKWLAPFLTVPYCLFAKGLILDGRPGLLYTLQRTYAELLLSLRLLDDDTRPAMAQNEQMQPKNGDSESANSGEQPWSPAPQ